MIDELSPVEVGLRAVDRNNEKARLLEDYISEIIERAMNTGVLNCRCSDKKISLK